MVIVILISRRIHKQNTVLDTSHGIPDVLNVSSTGAEKTPNSSSNLFCHSFIRDTDQTGPYGRHIRNTVYGPWSVSQQKLQFHRSGDLVSSPDAHLITGTVPCLKPQKIGCKISNPKYESLIINCMSLYVGFAFRVMDLMSRFLGLERVQYLYSTLPILFN